MTFLGCIRKDHVPGRDGGIGTQHGAADNEHSAGGSPCDPPVTGGQNSTPSCRPSSSSSNAEAQNHLNSHSPSPTDTDTASLRDVLQQQQQAMISVQLTVLNNLVEVSSSPRRRLADVRSSGDHPPTPTSRPWKLDMPTLQVPEDTDLSYLPTGRHAGRLRCPDPRDG